MILGIYGLQIKSAYEAALAARESINYVVAAYKTAYKRGESGELFIKHITDVQTEFIAAGDALKEAIAKAARNA